jgi:hypothetical protein
MAGRKEPSLKRKDKGPRKDGVTYGRVTRRKNREIRFWEFCECCSIANATAIQMQGVGKATQVIVVVTGQSSGGYPFGFPPLERNSSVATTPTSMA